MTVKELIERLKQFPPNLPVGRGGYYGEFHPMDTSDIYKKTAMPFRGDTFSGEFVNIDTPDLGEYPD